MPDADSGGAERTRLGTQMMVLGTQVSLLGLAVAHYFSPVPGLATFAAGFLGTLGVFMES